MDSVKVMPPSCMSKCNGSRGESGKEASSFGGHIYIGFRVLVNILDHDHDTMTEGGISLNCAPNVVHDMVVGLTEGDQDRVRPRRT
jgi:hypothetical protein